MRAESAEDRKYWIEVLQSFQLPDSSGLKRYPSSLSIQSTLSTNSTSTLSRNLREKLYEIETYRDLLVDQIETLQKYFDVCGDQLDEKTLETDYGLKTVNFRGESITFRETCNGMISY